MTTAEDRLDNPVWWALSTVQAAFAEGVGAARRYRPEVSVFAALERLDGDAWATLAGLAPPATVFVLARAEAVVPPPGWTVEMSGVGHQMRADRLEAPPRPDRPVAVRDLTADDLAAVLELIELARPGPFTAGTIQLGSYVGVVEDGRLLAMAGERLHLPGFTEVSAVATHPEARRRGLAATVTHHVARAIRQRGETPILHVADGNVGAQRVYERLGFRERRTMSFMAVRSPAGSPG